MCVYRQRRSSQYLSVSTSSLGKLGKTGSVRCWAVRSLGLPRGPSERSSEGTSMPASRTRKGTAAGGGRRNSGGRPLVGRLAPVRQCGLPSHFSSGELGDTAAVRLNGRDLCHIGLMKSCRLKMQKTRKKLAHGEKGAFF
jgi:hypothetical protein